MKAAYTGWMWIRQYENDTALFRANFIESAKELSELGFKYLENWTFLRDHFSAKEVRDICAQYDTEMVGLYANMDEGLDSLKIDVDYIADMGGKWMIVASPNWPADTGLDSPIDNAEIAREAALLNELGRYAVEKGVTIVHNPHSFTPVSRREETDILMSLTNPEYVGLCVDAGHSVVSGVDAAKLVLDYADRVKYIHIKDLDPELAWRGRGMSWVPLGRGSVDLHCFNDALEKIGYDGVVCAGLPSGCEWINRRESARVAREYLKNEFGF